MDIGERNRLEDSSFCVALFFFCSWEFLFQRGKKKILELDFKLFLLLLRTHVNVIPYVKESPC